MDEGRLSEVPEGAVVVELHHPARAVKRARAARRHLRVDVGRVLVPAVAIRVVCTDKLADGGGGGGARVGVEGIFDDQVALLHPLLVLRLAQRFERPGAFRPDDRARRGRRGRGCGGRGCGGHRRGGEGAGVGARGRSPRGSRRRRRTLNRRRTHGSQRRLFRSVFYLKEAFFS